MLENIAGVTVPDTDLTRQVTDVVRRSQVWAPQLGAQKGVRMAAVKDVTAAC